MTEAKLDLRLNAYRPDLADIRLKGKVNAARFAEGSLKRIVAPTAPLKRVPRAETSLDSELIRGEIFRVFGDTADGWSWGQGQTDSYVGFVPTAALGPTDPAPTHRIVALRTFVYPGPDMKLPVTASLSIGSLVTLGAEIETRGTLYRQVAGSKQAIAAIHTELADAPSESDFVAVAERFLNVPYLWGGRSAAGVDCSALVQLSMMMAGKAVPRDTDMQMNTIGEPIPGGIDAQLRRGDLVFWPSHVAIVSGPDRIVHASGHHMMVVTEPLSGAIARIGAVKGPPTAARRP
jgi:cell wall-associated NlpC family hydrolase